MTPRPLAMGSGKRKECPRLASTPHPRRNVKKETFGEVWLAWGLGLQRGRDLMLGRGGRTSEL